METPKKPTETPPALNFTRGVLVDPYLFSRAEGFFRHRNPAAWQNIQYGYQKLESRLENWGKIVPLDHATEVGKAIATRLETFGDHWVNTEQDQQTIDYLATSSAGTFFGYSELGQTTDTGDPSRRARIVSFLKSTEDSWIQKHGQPSNEKQWSDYYSRLLTFLNPKDAPIESDNKAGWILSYSVYYLTVWNYKEINGFEKADSNDPLEIKFRGFLGAALDKGRPFIHSLIEKMSTLDKSTRIVINDHGPKGIATKFDSMLARMPIRRNDST